MATLGSTFARTNIVNNTEKEPFWDKWNGQPGYYSDLNKVEVPGLAMIQAFQLQRIKNYEQTVVMKDKYKDVEGLTKDGFDAIMSIAAGEQDKALRQAIANVVAAATTVSPRARTPRTEEDYERTRQNFEKLANAIQHLMNVAQMNNNVVAIADLQSIRDAMHACELGSLDPQVVRATMNRMWYLQGEIVEEAGVDWLNSLHIPNITAIRTGNISLSGTTRAGRHNQSIIQDMLILDTSNPDIMDTVIIEYIPIGGESFEQHTLGEFLAYIEANAGNSKQIRLSDAGYDALLNLNQISVQAKSGFKQALWNPNAKYGRFSIGEFPSNDGLSISVHHTFELLHSLDLESPKDIWVNDNSKDYNALVNYGIGTIMAKVLHLDAIEGNQLVLTPGGFQTFSERMAYLFKQYKFIAKVRESVTINSNTLGTPYSVELGKG